jgi:NTP pyrophosphatase (non-canonical NTP hydrolase)
MNQTVKTVGHADYEQCLRPVLDELRKAETKHPSWPDDVVHGAAVMVEEAGESMQAALDHYYRADDTTLGKLRKELAQTGAMCIRMLAHLPGETRP